MSNKPTPPKRSPKPVPQIIKASDLSQDSLDVIESFGIEAPSLLNNYACALEDALIEQVAKQGQLNEEILRLRALLEKHNISH